MTSISAAPEGTIAVVGAGPHALTCCSYLLTVRPDWHHRLVVIDPDGWLVRWDGISIGALAPNLAGARIAAERIVGSFVPLSDRRYPTPAPTGAGGALR